MSPEMVQPAVPVGMFDSGIGGFTVLKELLGRARGVEVLYFGDTYHLPYGERPLGQIRLFALSAIDFLVGEGAKVIAVACNVSSSVLTPGDIEDAPVPVFGLVSGGAESAVGITRNGKIGVIATEATVKSHSYEREIKLREPDAEVVEVPCPKFVPLIEAGERTTPAVTEASREYLAPILSAGCDTVIHGCSHYPLLQEALDDAGGGKLEFVDPAVHLAEKVAHYLRQIGAEVKNNPGNEGKTSIFLSEYSEVLVERGGEYLGRDISSIIEVRNINRHICEGWEEHGERQGTA